MELSEHLIENIRTEFRKAKSLAEKAIVQLNDQELFTLPANESNSVAIIMRHLSGNMLSRWTDFFTTDGEKPDRNRDQEFETGNLSRADLLADWEKGWKVFLSVIDDLKPEDLLKTIYIRKEPHSVLQAVLRQHSHYNYHIGQIVQLAKIFKGEAFQSLSIPKGESEKFNERLK